MNASCNGINSVVLGFYLYMSNPYRTSTITWLYQYLLWAWYPICENV